MHAWPNPVAADLPAMHTTKQLLPPKMRCMPDCAVPTMVQCAVPCPAHQPCCVACSQAALLWLQWHEGERRSTPCIKKVRQTGTQVPQPQAALTPDKQTLHQATSYCRTSNMVAMSHQAAAVHAALHSSKREGKHTQPLLPHPSSTRAANGH